MNNVERISLDKLITLERRQVEVIPDNQYAEIGIYCFGRGIFHKPARSGLEVGDKSLFLIREGDFILQVTFAWEGAVALASSSDDGMFGSTRYPTFRVDETQCFPPYLVNYFRTPEGLAQLIKISPGSAGRNRVLSLKRIPEVFIPLPPLSEQRRIVARLEELAAKIEEARKLRQQAKEEAKLLSRSGAEHILSQTSQASLRPLHELITIQGGGTPSKSNPLFWQGSIPWVSPKDMKSRVIADAQDHISEEATRITAAKLINPGAVLIVVRGMILAHTVPSAVLKVPAAINQDMKALIASKDILPEYLCGVFWALNDQLLNLVEKSTHDTRKLETHRLLDFKIPVPSIHQQKQTLTLLNDLQAQVETLNSLQADTAAELDALMPAILDKAFRGEL